MRSVRWIVVLAVAACTPSTPGTDMTDAATMHALDFVRALCARDYDRAYAMTSTVYQDRVSSAAMRDAFEGMVPLDWGGTDPVEVGSTIADWPAKQSGDVASVYVSIYGDVYSEGVGVVVTLEGTELKVREVEWGRP